MFTKIYKIDGTDLEVEEMSNGYTTLWNGNKKILNVYPPTIISQEEMCEKIKSLFPDWKEGQITRIQ